ncbi:M10 family metallopeptidase [Tritonibacter mobilis]|uniref:M10 family metallopeptidase n=1 Tax=Tritonibacter mobilis TaxID=379347 RepID=UPI000806CF49|nr:M10 family metallopeptidase [Tritonibacter mobilis]MCZ4270086.1 M10 family metallopeptidase [Rhodobacteraceae bacterium G21628-S1]
MCFLCNATQTFDPLRHGEDSGQDFATISESSDALASSATSYSISVGDTFTGTRSSAGDDDWVAVTLTVGETYVFDLDGSGGGGGTLPDTDLYLYDASGNQLAYDDMSGESYDAELTFEATYTGTYYVVVSSYYPSDTGSYTLTVGTQEPEGAASLDELAVFLTDGYWEGTFRSGRSFDTYGSNQITVNITGLTAAGQQLARWAFEAWERVADLEFVETTSSLAKITFDDAASGAYAQSVVSGGTILSSVVNVSTSWLSYYGTDIDTYSFQTYVHEIGHALGLGHQGAYNGNATYGTDETFINDSWQLSVMSYFDQVDNTTTNASFGYIVSTMMADIVAIQNLYGAPDEDSETAGDTTWGANTTLTDSYLSEVFGALEGDFSFNMTGNDFALTIYDVSGTDTIDLSPNTTNDRIDLNDESFSDVAGRIGNLGIARDTVIENVITGSGNDTITGNEVGNEIHAGNGTDIISGGAGDDTIFGGADALDLRDVVYGGAGNDSIDGGYGNDELRGDAGNDSIEGGFGSDTVIGGDGDDVLTGSALSDQVFGGAGSDFVNGGFGHDRVNGGGDADKFFHLGVANHGSDWIQDYDAAEGDVLVFGNSSATIDQFQINFAETENAGEAGVEEAFVIYRPTGQIMWALVDGAAQDEIILRINGTDYDLMA